METLVINIPESKSALVKKMLKEFGVTIGADAEHPAEQKNWSVYKERILKVGVWSENDVKPIENAKEGFNTFKPEQW